MRTAWWTWHAQLVHHCTHSALRTLSPTTPHTTCRVVLFLGAAWYTGGNSSLFSNDKIMYDILIKNGTVIDGTGAPMTKKDIAIQDGVIAAIDDLSHEIAHEVYDATDRYITPGFIDVNNHSDAYWKIFTNPTLDSLVHQGVTTIIGGNSGASLAPLLTPDMIKGVRKWTDVSRVNVNWRTMQEFFDVVASRKLAVNFGSLVGHSTLRRALLHDEQRALTADELDKVAQMLDNALRDGALGLSTALLYAHARSATREELVRLAQIVARYDGVYVAYLSDEMDGLLDALADVIAIAREAGVRLHIAHLKAVGKENWPLMHQALTALNEAREEGLIVTSDVYPYTMMSAVLYTLLPQWVTDGGRTMMLARLKDPQTRAQVVDAMRDNPQIDLGEAIVSVSPIVKQLSRRKIADIARAQEKSVEETIIDLLLASNGQAIVLLDALGEDGVRAALAQKNVMVASNGGGYAEKDWQTGELIHPRSFGAFARLLGHYVRDEHVLSWEDAIHKITALPAQQFGLARRGQLAKGMIADIAIVDPATIAQRATTEQPYRYADGVTAVLIGGLFVLRDGVITPQHAEIVRPVRV